MHASRRLQARCGLPLSESLMSAWKAHQLEGIQQIKPNKTALESVSISSIGNPVDVASTIWSLGQSSTVAIGFGRSQAKVVLHLPRAPMSLGVTSTWPLA